MPNLIAKCKNPLDQSRMAVRDREIDDSLVVTGYIDPAVEGSSINLSCSSGVLTGPTMTTCMQNGEWKPDPVNAECKGEQFIKWSLSGNLVWTPYLCHSGSCKIRMLG